MDVITLVWANTWSRFFHCWVSGSSPSMTTMTATIIMVRHWGCGNCRRAMGYDYKQTSPIFWCREGQELIGQTKCSSEIFQANDIENAVFQAWATDQPEGERNEYNPKAGKTDIDLVDPAATRSSMAAEMVRDVPLLLFSMDGRETHFIPNGVNRPQIREASLITDKFGLKKDSYILFLGRLVPEKGIRYLVEAFKNVKTDKKLVIAGGSSDTDSFMEELKDLAKGDDRILFTGFVQGAMLDELYSNKENGKMKRAGRQM